MRQYGNEVMRQCGNEVMRQCGNEVMRQCGNVAMRRAMQAVGARRAYRATPNVNTVFDRYASPGRSTVDGKVGRFGESG